MTARAEKRRASECEGKFGYDDDARAQEHADRLNADLRRSRRHLHGRFYHTYECRWCHLYHVGRARL